MTTATTIADSLTEAQQITLGQMIADAIEYAIEYRQPGTWCDDCESSPSGLCQPCADDFDQPDRYKALARTLGVEVDEL